MEKVKHAGKIVSFKKMVASSHQLRYCAICDERVTVGQDMFIVTATDRLFPNRLIHEACITPPPAPFDKNNRFVWAAAKLHELWKEARKHRHWFED